LDEEKTLSWEKIRLRRINYTRTEDKTAIYFKSTINLKCFRVRFKDTKPLQSIVRNFLQQCRKALPNDNSSLAVEDLLNQISQWKYDVSLASITNLQFDAGVRYCKKSNEAVFRRTLMMSIIDRWQLPEIFGYNCQGQWMFQRCSSCLLGREETCLLCQSPNLPFHLNLKLLHGPILLRHSLRNCAVACVPTVASIGAFHSYS
jgi:hypothetical protein